MAKNIGRLVSLTILGPLGLARMREPIFIIAPPRSGSSFLFECLSQFDETYHTIGREGEYIWWKLFPYTTKSHPTDYLGWEDASPYNVRAMRRMFYDESVRFYTGGKQPTTSLLRYLFGLRNIQYLDKTISNCFHLEFLKRAFPDAHYLFLVRDPRENVSSMLEGWPQLNRFGKKDLSGIVSRLNGTITHWTYPAPPGWQQVVYEPLQNICAWSWCRHIQSALDGLKSVRNRTTEVRYETLRDHPRKVIVELADALGLRMTQKVQAFLDSPPNSRTTLSQPLKDKWVEIHGDLIREILPLVRETAAEVGYEV